MRMMNSLVRSEEQKEPNNKISNLLFYIFLIEMFLFPILPQYFYIFNGVNIVNIVNVVFLVIVIILERKIFFLKLPFSIYFFGIYYIIVCLFTGSIFKSFTYCINLIIIPMMIVHFITSYKKLHKTINVLIFGGFILGILGIIEEITKVNIFQTCFGNDISFFHEIRYGLLRIMGPFGHPIGYGLYHVFIISLINYKWKNKVNNVFLILAFIICGLNIIFTVSRIPILCFAVLEILFFLSNTTLEKKVGKFVILIIMLLITITILCILKVPFIDDIVKIIKSFFTDDTVDISYGVGDRFDLYKWVYTSMDNFEHFFGKGFNSNFSYKLNEWFTKTSIENEYLNMFFTLGYVGVIFFIISYLNIIRYSLKSIHQSLEGYPFAKMFLLLIITYIVAMLGTQETDVMRIRVIFLSILIAEYCFNKKVKLKNKLNSL